MTTVSWIAKWGIRGIAKTQARLFRLTEEKNPDATTEEILATLLHHRFYGRAGFGEEQENRLDTWLAIKGVPTTLCDLCVAIAAVEHKIDTLDFNAEYLIREIIQDVLNSVK